MANQDRVNFVWAESALTTIPPIPVPEVAYRDTTQTPEQMEVGQKYDTIYNSARHNQLLFLLTSVAKTLCENGIMPFLAGQEYSQYARCIFTDGKLYTASRAILANEQPYPTPGDDSGVWTTEETGKNLVPNSRRVIAGTGLTGGGPLSSDVTLAAKLTNSVSLTDSTTAASATAVKTAYDRGTTGVTAAREAKTIAENAYDLGTTGVTAAGEAKTIAENALAVANTKQPKLGFTPIQQGGGTGQGTNKVYIGWATDASGLKAQADSTNLGNIVTTAGGTIKAPQAALADRAQVANTSETLFVTGWGNTKWGSTPYGQSPLYVWCLPSGGSDMMPCSPGVLSAGAANFCTYTPNVRVGTDGSVLPAGGTWRIMTSRNGDGNIMDLAGGSAVSTVGGVFMAIRVA